MIDWAKGFESETYMTKVDPVTWLDTERIEITEGSISKNGDGLRESASATCRQFDTQKEEWIRIYMDARQGGDVSHGALFTGLVNAPETSVNGSRKEYPLECYSVLKPCEDILLQRGWYAGAGESGAKVIKRLLSVTPAPVVIDDDSPHLEQSIIAEDGESNLSMIEKILDAINWRLRIEGDGTIHVCEKASEISSEFGLYNDVIEPEIKLTDDWFSCPNVFRAVMDDQVSVAKDESEGLLSIPTRGREIWMEETSCNLNKNESLAMYAKRRLREEQARVTTLSYARRYDPAVYVGDIVKLHYPEQGLMEEYTVISQNIALGLGGYVSEEVQR